MSETCQAPYRCPAPRTDAERQAFATAPFFTSLLMPPRGGPLGLPDLQCGPLRLQTFDDTLVDHVFELDHPAVAALLPQLVERDPEAAALLLGALQPPERPLEPAEADAALDRLLDALRGSITGDGNWPGHLAAGAETALREHWRRQAARAFEALITGAQQGSIALSPHVTVQAHRIGKGGELRRGARLVVRVRGLPVKVVQQLPSAFVPKAGARWGTLQVGARNLQQLQQAQVAVATARVQINPMLRAATRGGGALLAFGPSAGIDFYQAYTRNDGFGAVAHDFAVRSAQSQVGNALGWGLGLAAVAVVGVTGAPAVLLALGTGVVVQTVFTALGGAEASGRLADQWLR